MGQREAVTWWTPERTERLRALWAANVSTEKIAQQLHTSKNAAVGKAHRMNLPSRPSPIKRSGAGKEDRASRPKGEIRCLATTLRPIASAREMAAANVPLVIRPRRNSEPCCWPIGEPGTPAFRYCDEASLPGRAYCEQHTGIAYVRARDRDEDAA